MTDDQQPTEDFTEEFAWIRQVCADTPATPEAIDRAVDAVTTEVRRTARARDNAAPANVRRENARAAWVRWSPWIALIATLCIVIALGEQHLHTDRIHRKAVAALSDTQPFSTLVPPPITGHPARSGTDTHTSSPPSTATPSPKVFAHPPTVAMLPHAGDGDITPPPLVAPSQTPTVSPSLSPSQARAIDGLDSTSATLIIGILDSAQAHGLPIERVVTRIHEGVQRGVPPVQIVAVTRNYVASLANARTTLGIAATSAEVQAGAEALLAGAPPSALQRLRAARPTGSLVESLIALADLCTHGVAPLQASMALATLVAHDESDTRVLALRTNVIADITRGVRPDAALAYRARQSTTSDGFKSAGGGVDSRSSP